jgi:MFS family permease
MSRLGQPSFITYFDLDTRPDATDLISTTNGIFQAGGVIGTLLLPIVADRWGRKMGIALVSVRSLFGECIADV